jgi:hypothetical protein
MEGALRDFGRFANNRDVKHAFHVGVPMAQMALQKLKTGGAVKMPKGRKSIAVILHRNEYVLPSGVKPTMAQKKAVAARKKKELK